MPYTIKTGYLNVKDENGRYIRNNTVAEQSTAEQIAEIEAASATQQAAIVAKGEEVRQSVPPDYTALSNSFDAERSFVNSLTRNYIPVWEQGRITNSGEVASPYAIRTHDYLPIAPGETVWVDYDASLYTSRVVLVDAPTMSGSSWEYYGFSASNMSYKNNNGYTEYARFVLQLPISETLLPKTGYAAYTISRQNAIITYDMPVTPQLYGAVGDGVTDDTAAFQAAINSGYSVYIPTGHNEIYKITGTLNVPNKCKRIFGDVIPTGHYDGGYILFDLTGSSEALSDLRNTSLFQLAYNAQAISIARLYVQSIKKEETYKLGTFLNANTITSGGKSLVDKDISLEDITATHFYRIAQIAGRGFNAINCNFASPERIAEFTWLKTGDTDSNQNYPSDYNQRGISFKNCRLHSVASNMFTFVSGHAYGFEIVGCVADLGSGKIITAVDEAWNWNISGNVFQGLVTGPSLEFRKGMKNCTISNNIFSADTTMKSTQGAPKNFILIGNENEDECITSGCTISGNAFREPSEHHIVIGGTTINGLSISGNAFDQTPEGYNPVRFDQNATNVSFAGNTDTNARTIYSVASGKTVGIYSNSI